MDEQGLLGRVICLLIGATLLSAGNLWIPVWLGLRPEEEITRLQVSLAVIDGLFAVLIAALLDSGRRLLNRPLPPRRQRRPARKPAGPAVESRRPVPLPQQISEPVRSDKDDDVIMIELD